MFLMHFVTLCRKCLKKTDTVVSCLMKCRSERMSDLIRNLTAVRDLRILQVGGRACNIANHALLFTVRGLHRKWKQPVAHHLSRGSTKAEKLVQFLNGVLGACQNVGLHVVTTVCDMGTNNVKTMKLLGSTTSEPFFQFQNQAIAKIYDPPHLLKCTHNLFLKYDVQLA